jgi:hypothetical protein
MKNRLRSAIASALIVATAGTALPLPATAGMIGTESAVAAASRDRIGAALARADVRARLEAAGVRADEVQARVNALTDGEAAQLAQQLDSLPAGGDGIVGAIVLVFIVLLLTDILGYTKVFPFTRQAR